VQRRGFPYGSSQVVVQGRLCRPASGSARTVGTAGPTDYWSRLHRTTGAVADGKDMDGIAANSRSHALRGNENDDVAATQRMRVIQAASALVRNRSAISRAC